MTNDQIYRIQKLYLSVEFITNYLSQKNTNTKLQMSSILLSITHAHVQAHTVSAFKKEIFRHAIRGWQGRARGTCVLHKASN